MATAVAVAAWLALAISVLFGAFERLGEDASAASAAPTTAAADARNGATAAPASTAPGTATGDATDGGGAVASGAGDPAGDAPEGAEAPDGDGTDAAAREGGETVSPADGDDADPADSAIVDWPDIPEVAALEPVTVTEHFTVTVADADDALLVAAAEAWAPALEPLLAEMSLRVGRALPNPPVAVVFAETYPGRCPARGLASPGEDVPLLMVMLDEGTPDVQVRAVLAHEIVHHLTYQDDFVGDSVLTEGVANWGADAYALAWQGWPSWSDAARSYLAEGTYVSVADDTGQVPRDGEDCLARRDRVYNVRAAFVAWLVATYGRETVLAMPAREVPDPDDAEGEPLRVPDYEAATGLGLVALERRWLAELTGDPTAAAPSAPAAAEGAGDALADEGAPSGATTPGGAGARP